MIYDFSVFDIRLASSALCSISKDSKGASSEMSASEFTSSLILTVSSFGADRRSISSEIIRVSVGVIEEIFFCDASGLSKLDETREKP